MKRIIFLLALLIPKGVISAQTVIYVNQNASGAQTGETWADAFTDLQDALASAFSGFEIWVAQGEYKPTAGVDRHSSFYLKSNVKLYGGFNGNETSVGQRNPALYPTILSGEIGDPDTRADNVYHVAHGKGLGENTLIDGFIIRGGYSFNDFSISNLDGIGGGMLLEGAPWISNSRPKINNCRFENNGAQRGGGLGIVWNDPDDSNSGHHRVNPQITACTFTANKANIRGGGIYKSGSTGPDTFIVENCILADNSVWGADGGGVGFAESPDSRILFRKCTFERDTAFQGGGVFLASTDPSYNTIILELDSCLFSQNLALDGAGIYYDGYVLENTSFSDIDIFFKLSKCRFEFNSSITGDGPAYLFRIYHSSTLNAEIKDCLFSNNVAGYFTTQLSIGSGSKGNFVYQDCIFFNNQSRLSSSCFCIEASCGGSVTPNHLNVKVKNCLLERNGGSIIVTSAPNNYVSTEITNCTFYKNNSPQFVKSLWGVVNDFSNYYRIENCVIWEPDTDFWSMFYNNDNQNLTMYGFEIDNTITSLPGPGFLPGAAQAYGSNILWGQYPMFVDTAGGDFRLLPCSPAHNAGNNDKTEDAGLETDLAGFQRIRFGTVDMGAYETQDSCVMDAAAPVAAAINNLELLNNPSSDGILAFNAPSDTDAESVLEIYHSDGRKYKTIAPIIAENNRIDMGSSVSGIYTIVLRVRNGVYIGKWVKL